MRGLPEKTKTASGAAPISQATNFVVATVTVGKGRYTVYGSTRHTLADGVKLSVGPAATVVDVFTIPNQPTGIGIIPLYTFDGLTVDTVVQLRLAVATGGADTAAGVVSCQLEQSV
jgi:hypothetical protein